ncbi:MAG TPA: TonB family protein [Candidatus Sulfotelmatobacter sp.]|nr:TonB family protein [Candidatus Sulfotelmatobacter sp.]
MPITQIPFQDPVAPPEKPQPEQLGLYDTKDWETAYRDLDAAVPHLLIQLQDDLARSRKREAAWISIIAHLMLAILLFSPLFDMIQKAVGWHSVAVVPLNTEDKNTTFLALPPDLQKARRPNTNVLSDKNRIATSRHPELDPKELRKILASPPPGAPGPQGPRTAQPAAPPAMAQQAAPQQGQQQAAQRPQFEPNQTAQLQMPPRPNNSFSKYAGAMSAGAAIQQATQAAAARRAAGIGGGGQEGDFGLGTGAHGRQLGALDILSDTQGVDFGPYLERILQDVRENWYHLIPESAEMKKGKLAIEFAITKQGQVADMRLVASSGDIALDRPAWGSITASNPFPPLPTDFTGPYLALRFRFYYNPDKADLN